MTKATTAYFLCTIPRSGSGFLCDTLWNTEIAGRPGEFFCTDGYNPYYLKLWQSKTFPEYLRQVIDYSTTLNGVFGVKIMLNQLHHLLTKCDGKEDANSSTNLILLKKVFPNLKFVWLRRQNSLRQAISWYKKDLTGQFSKRSQNNDYHKKNLEFSFAQIERIQNEIIKQDECWDNFFQENKIAPLVIIYEHLTNNLETTIFNILSYLKIQLPFNFKIKKSNYRKQSDELTDKWEKRYLKIKRIL